MWALKPSKNINSLEGKKRRRRNAWCPGDGEVVVEGWDGTLEKEKTGRSKGEVMGALGWDSSQ